jgi:lipopolysaccharide export LptBFGC system permease protein LptF
MKNDTFLTSSNAIVKKLFVSFGFAFLFVFALLAINQILLLSNFKNQISFSQGILLFFYSLPAAIVFGPPFAVCIGFAYGLVKMNFTEKLSQNKRYIMSVFITALIISICTLIVGEFVYPYATKNFIELYQAGFGEYEIQTETPRAMSSIKLLQAINEIKLDGKGLNAHILELHKKYSIPFGSLFFAFFAMALSLVLKKHLQIALCVSLLSCVVYWVCLWYGQNLSIKIENHGALAMWLPNILFLCISIILCFIKSKPPASVRAANVEGFNGA